MFYERGKELRFGMKDKEMKKDKISYLCGNGFSVKL